uniref:replicative DNA helicase n=1 Tax=Sphaerisporangium sp. CA-236357 TaxID=3240030 RepID=UPI003F491A34
MRYVDGILQDSQDLSDWLLPQLVDATVVAFKTSFFTMAGAETIGPSLLRLLEKGGCFHAVLGGSPEQTDPGALRVLAAIAADFPDRATIHLAAPGGGWQNAKTYYVRDGNDRAVAYIGSANLTRGGLTANHEAGIVLDTDVDGKDMLAAVFDGIRAWAEHPDAELVTPEVVTAFTQRARLARIGRARRPGPADPTWGMLELIPEALDLIEAIGSRGDRMIGIPTGFTDLDKLINGLPPGSLTVIGGRPAMGKSVLLMDFVRSASIKHQTPAALFSLEMDRTEVTLRLLSAEARVPLINMRGGLMNDGEWTRLARRMPEVAEVPLHINDTGSLTIGALCEAATRLVRDEGVQLIAVDCLQLISADLRAETREREVSDVAHALKALARDLKVAVVVAAQLNRNPEQRTDKMPTLADLRESDAIAQAADIVILLHREDAYERESPRAGEADFIVAKHRNGPTATVTVAFQGHYSRFVDMAPH